ncbi:hypothetical protein [Edwardsiella piscicida]|uniref:hypothetical protein n=1 Tax=Edwardsiella piscicida TaxID=1263550 RepID=UPI00370D097E
MNLAPPFSSESLFFLSRLDASAEINGLRIQADRHQPSGSGLCLESRCDDLAIALWVGAEWSGWLTPQLAAPSLAHIEPDLHPAVAGWLLSPLNAWLQAASLPELASPTLHQAEAPKCCWRLTFTRADARLSLYMTQIAPALLTRWLAALTPPAEREHTLPLVLGWCWLAAEEAAKIAPGDALPLQGMAPQPDCFWLSSPDSPEQLRLNDAESGVVVRAALPTVALAAADEIVSWPRPAASASARRASENGRPDWRRRSTPMPTRACSSPCAEPHGQRGRYCGWTMAGPCGSPAGFRPPPWRARSNPGAGDASPRGETAPRRPSKHPIAAGPGRRRGPAMARTPEKNQRNFR